MITDIGRLLFIPSKTVEALDDPDHLSTTSTIFRNGPDGGRNIAFIEINDEIKALLREKFGPEDLNKRR